MIDIDNYQKECKKTAIYPTEYSVIYPVIGMCGETGEVAEKIKKIIRDKNSIFDETSKIEIMKELGDVMWYISNIATDLNVNMSDILTMNLDKIQSRQSRNKIHGSGDNR